MKRVIFKLDSKSSGFLSVDIIFSLVIMSFSFIILFQVQLDITKEIQRKDVQDFGISNQHLLNNIKLNTSQNKIITTNNKKQYNVSFFETNAGDEIKIYYLKVNP